MAINALVVHAPRERVFAILANPKHYGYFVVGTRMVRMFDPNWPDPDSRLHHSLGFGVTLIRDSTRVLEMDEPHHLDLRTGMGPLGASRTTFRLSARPDGTHVEIEEFPVDGLVATDALSMVVERMIGLRNWELLRRLRRLAEQDALEQTAEVEDS